MKKRIPFVLMLVMAFLLACSTSALADLYWNHTQSCNPGLSFKGTTANCTLYIKAYDDSAEITATLKLIRENTDGTETIVRTWRNLSDTGSLTFSDTKSVTSGKTYRLEVSAKIKAADGSETLSEYVRATCP